MIVKITWKETTVLYPRHLLKNGQSVGSLVSNTVTNIREELLVFTNPSDFEAIKKEIDAVKDKGYQVTLEIVEN